MLNARAYLSAQLNNFYIDKYEEESIDEEAQDQFIEELQGMEAKELYDLCLEYEIPIPQAMFVDIFGNFIG